MLMDKLKHHDVKYIEGKEEAAMLVNSERFKKISTLDQEQELYEVELRKKILNIDIPLQIGFTILQYAKLRMLEMYYDFLDYFIERNNFELAEMDTDSLYIGFTHENIHQIIKKEKRKEFNDLIYNNCQDIDIIPEKRKFFIPRQCCTKHEAWDSKIPGLFKKEYHGNELISLNSKCYIGATKELHSKLPIKPITEMIARKLVNTICKRKPRTISKQISWAKKKNIGFISYKIKLSCKGISKRNLKNPLYTFRKVLFKRTSAGSLNKGFITKNNFIYTYTQFRQGFTYFYIKREILDDGIHSIPLKLTLTPISRNIF